MDHGQNTQDQNSNVQSFLAILGELETPTLIEIQGQIEKQIQKNKKQAKLTAFEKFQNIADQFGLSVDEIVEVQAKAKPRGRKAGFTIPPKYWHPEHPEQTWTGRGRQPRWLTEDMSQTGNPLEHYLIPQEQQEHQDA